MKLLCMVLLCAATAMGQDLAQEEIGRAFDAAGREFGVPPAVLKGIAFAETRWQHLVWAEGDTVSCAGLPREYGIMGLRDDRFFGRSLAAGAALIGETPATVRRDLLQNIRAAAAYVRSLYDRDPRPEGTSEGSLESWQTAIASYSGIPQPSLAAQHACEILTRLNAGYHDFGIVIPPAILDVQRVRATAAKIYAAAAQQPQLRKTTGQPDYPLAHWAAAYPNHWYTSGYARDFVVIHDMEGYYLSTVSYFQQAATDASVHYDVNGLQDSPSDAPAGDITQQVEEQYWAWHAICLNRYSLGIEHEGFESNPAWWTPEMYLASAKLVKYMCDKYGIPKDRNHIIGHGEYQNSTWVNWAVSHGYPAEFATCNSHTDPGPNWDWGFFMQMITGDSSAPRIVSIPPAGRVQVFDPLSVTFNQRLVRAGVEQSFHVFPPVTGAFSWKDNFRTLQFVPSSPMSFDTQYTVTVDTGAHNYFGAGIDVNGDGIGGGELYTFTVRTVAHDSVPPVIVGTYPDAHQPAVSTSVQCEVEMSETMDPTTLAGSFVLSDGSTDVPLTPPVAQSTGTGTRITIRPVEPLRPLSDYTLSVLPSMKDYGGNTIASTLIVPFVTGPMQSFNGTVINSFDALGSWWQPGTSGSTVGTTTTSFSIDTDIKKSGTGSGKVSYVFAGSSGGVVREYNSGKPTVDPGPYVACWVFGDNSRNALEYWFYPLAFVRVDTLDWTGWKLVAGSLATVPTTAVRQLAGLVIQQLPGGRTSGSVYFDDLGVGQAPLAVGQAPPAVPDTYGLHKNFPNPFNPSTKIRYDLGSGGRGVRAGWVKVSVYDMLGREVAVLVNEEQRSGSYEVTFDGRHLASGVYVYRLVAGAFVQSVTMMLLK